MTMDRERRENVGKEKWRRTKEMLGKGRDVNRSLRLQVVSLLVSHGFVFMNGFALVALREIVLSSLPQRFLSFLSLPPSITRYRAASSFGGSRRTVTEWKTAANRYFSRSHVGPGCSREREKENEFGICRCMS